MKNEITTICNTILGDDNLTGGEVVVASVIPTTPVVNSDESNISESTSLSEKRARQEKIILEYLDSIPTNVSPSRAMKEYAKTKYINEWPYLVKYWDSNLSGLANEADAKFRRIQGTYNYELMSGDTNHALENDDIEFQSENQNAPAPAVVPETEFPDEEKEKKRQEREKNLYPSLISWLATKKYFSKDTSTYKKGKQWGNPDVTGIKIINDIFGLERLEVCTIEAKAAATDWKNIYLKPYHTSDLQIEHILRLRLDRINPLPA